MRNRRRPRRAHSCREEPFRPDLQDTWSPDSMRHSYGTYRVATYESKSKTALTMGHSVRMLDRHYRRPLHRSDTTEFWNIFPPPVGN